MLKTESIKILKTKEDRQAELKYFGNIMEMLTWQNAWRKEKAEMCYNLSDTNHSTQEEK